MNECIFWHSQKRRHIIFVCIKKKTFEFIIIFDYESWRGIFKNIIITTTKLYLHAFTLCKHTYTFTITQIFIYEIKKSREKMHLFVVFLFVSTSSSSSQYTIHHSSVLPDSRTRDED